MVSDNKTADRLDPGDPQRLLTSSQTEEFLSNEMDFSDGDQCSVSRKRKSSGVSDSVVVRPKKVHETGASCRPPQENVGDSGAERVVPRDVCTLLVRPANDMSKKMFISPEVLCTALESEPFQSANIRDVRVNRRKGVLAIELVDEDESQMERLLKVKKLGPWQVSCSRPNKGRFCYGVVSPIDVDADLDALHRRVVVGGPSKFVKMERLTKWMNGQKVPSASVRFHFEGQQLPKSLKIGYNSYTVREYDFPPLQCFRCQRFGHSAQGCTNTVRCFVCSGQHSYHQCTVDQPKCANCGGPHKANSSDCGKAPRRAEKPQPGHPSVSTVNGGREDVWVVRPSQMSVSAGVAGRGSQALSGRSQRSSAGQVVRSREILANVQSGNSGFVSPAYNTVVSSPVVASHSFEGFGQSSPSCSGNCSRFSSSDFLSKFAGCLTDLFALSLHLESTSKVQSIISTAVQKHFGVALPSRSLSGVGRASADLSAVECVGDPADGSVVGDVAAPLSDVGSTSAAGELTTCLDVGNFELISDSDISVGGCAVDGWESVSSTQRGKGGKKPGKIRKSSQTLPRPSPILGAVAKRGHYEKGVAPGKVAQGSGHSSGSNRASTRSSTRGRDFK